MKKNWLTLFALACSVALFTACSDDDEPARASVDTVNGTYTSTDTEKQLALTYGDAVMTGKSVTFNSADGQSATITLTGAANTLLSGLTGQTVNNPGVIPGEASTTLNVTLVPQGETGYTFSGTDQSNDRTVAYTGSVEAGKLTLDVDVTFASNELTGTWNLYPAGDLSASTFPIFANWESNTKIVMDENTQWSMTELLALALHLPVFGSTDNPQSVDQMLAAVLQSITFGVDGNIIASYSDAANISSPTWQDSPAGMVQYCVKNGKLYAYLDIDVIMAAVMGTSSQADAGSDDLLSSLLPMLLGHMNEIAPLLTEGIPLGYRIDPSTGVLSVYIEKEGLGDVLINIATELLNDPEMQEKLLAMMPSDGIFGVFGALIIPQLGGVIGDTTGMELGLNFNPATTTAE